MRPLAIVICSTALGSYGQGLVSHIPQDCTVLIEQFTGVLNVNAPEANTTAETIEAAQPGQIAIVRAHTGVFAEPFDNDPDFRNEWADELAEQFDLVFVPSNMVNRTPAAGDLDLFMPQSQMPLACGQALALPSPVNLGLSSSFNPDNLELTITVELYYTAPDTGGTDHISLLLKEDHIIAGQQDANADPPLIPDYDHRHVLRAYITDIWGDPVPEADSGVTVQRTYSYVLPGSFNPQHCSVVAFVGKYRSVIYQAREVPAIGGTTVGLQQMTPAQEDLDLRFVNGQWELVFPETYQEQIEVTIVDATGRMIQEQSVMPGARSVRLSVHQAQAGIYVCSVREGTHVRTKRFLITGD